MIDDARKREFFPLTDPGPRGRCSLAGFQSRALSCTHARVHKSVLVECDAGQCADCVPVRAVTSAASQLRGRRRRVEWVPGRRRRQRGGVSGVVEGGGDVREVREGSRRRRLGCGGRPTRAREYAGDAPRRGEGDGAHAVRLGRAPGRRVGGAGANDRVDECLGVSPEAASLLHCERNEAVVGQPMGRSAQR